MFVFRAWVGNFVNADEVLVLLDLRDRSQQLEVYVAIAARTARKLFTRQQENFMIHTVPGMNNPVNPAFGDLFTDAKKTWWCLTRLVHQMQPPVASP